ncbi:MAG: polyphenol oxidase family protein [Candidatus Marinimicrobia bacterium]|nr:polyphenol oxidase family protein [Candidatus Neomarinimicrobiota bacterium]
MLKPQYLAYPKSIDLGFSTREGGQSTTPFHGLNMSTSRGDLIEHVAANRKLFMAQFNAHESQLAQPIQISQDQVEIVTTPGLYPACDALITETPGIYLSVLTADCSPILIWSEEYPVVAAVHSGWQGSELDILGKTLERMLDSYSITPAAISMVIGPGLSPENFKVGPEFSEKFQTEYLLKTAGGDRFYFDNNRYLKDTAMHHGIPADQIEILPYCSYRDDTLFFSHRRDQGITGRMMSVIGIQT